MSNMSSASQLSLKPLGAGDLIDRAVRLYRKNFWTFLLIAAPPIVLGTICLAGWMFLMRNLFYVGSTQPDEVVVYRLFVGLGGIVIWLIQLVAVMVVMGGAARNFVRHLLFGEAITFRETYKNTRIRLGGLIFVSTILTIAMSFVGFILFYLWVIVLAIGIGLASLVAQTVPIAVFVISLVIGIVATLGILWLFFLVVSRFVYIPQIMLVEGQSAMSAIGRSASLAGKNITRVGALSIFTVVAIYVALMLFYLPLGLYAWVEGVNLVSFDAVDSLPAWYEIAYSVISQGSLIMIIPVLMIGLCLLYVDERVRSEGYDIELLAMKRLGEMPDVPDQFVNPLRPALSKGAEASMEATGKIADHSTLGLD